MPASALSFISRHTRVRISTERPTEFIDITEELLALVRETGVRLGVLNVQTLHTTTAIVVNEHEPLLLDDFAMMLDRLAPADRPYRHDDASARTANLDTGDERINGHAHCRGLLLPTSACLNVIDGRLQLGTWQRIFLVELDGPRNREISVLLLGEAGR